MNKKIIIPAAAVLIAGAAIYTSGQVSAQGFGSGQDTLIQKLAQAFGKSEDEVKEVFEEMHDEHKVEMQERQEERLDEAVASGEITEDQKQLILNKHEELKAQHEADFENKDNLSKEEWGELKQSYQQDLEQWASENGIDLQYFHQGMGKHMKGNGHMKFGKFGQRFAK